MSTRTVYSPFRHSLSKIARRVGLAKVTSKVLTAARVAEAQIEEAREITRTSAQPSNTASPISTICRRAMPASIAGGARKALLYAIDKEKVIREGLRKPGGALVLTDLVLDRRLPAIERETFVTAMKAPQMSSPEELDAIVAGMGLRVADRRDWSEHATPTYAKLLVVLDKLIRERADASIARRSTPWSIAFGSNTSWHARVTSGGSTTRSADEFPAKRVGPPPPWKRTAALV